MDVVRRLVSAPPEQRDFHQDKPTLLVSWWCTGYAITIILFRVCGKYVRTEKVSADDGIMLLAIIPLVIRMALVHVILVYGTNNTVTIGLSSDDIRQREIGSQLVLVSRVMYTAYLWAVKYSVSMFLRTLTESVWQRSHQKMLRYLHIFLAITFGVAVISDLAACQPFTHYWQVVPDPGPRCRQGYAVLFTTGIMNIITNLTLVALPIPMIIKSRLTSKRKWSIVFRMAFPLIGVALTTYQIPSVVSRLGSQQFRSLIASFDILVTTFTSNAVALGSMLQDRGYKKAKYKRGAGIEFDGKQPGTRVNTLHNRWGSDEDLMRADEDGKVITIDMENLRRPEAPAKAKFPEIRVATTWEVKTTVERSASLNQEL